MNILKSQKKLTSNRQTRLKKENLRINYILPLEPRISFISIKGYGLGFYFRVTTTWRVLFSSLSNAGMTHPFLELN